jgi:hypothetical protein
MQDALLGESGSINATPARAAPGKQVEKKAVRERLQCLDAVRGLNVILMMFVDNAGNLSEYWIDHSPWNGIHLADFVMPLFLFMVGLSMAFSMKKYGGPGLKWKILSRTLKLFVLGCLTQGADWIGAFGSGSTGIDLAGLRIPGILQRIAWAYCVVALMKLWLPVYTRNGFVPASAGKWEDAPRHRFAIFAHYSLHWAVAFGFFFLYVGIMLFAHVPDWEWREPGHYQDPDCVVSNTSHAQVCTSEWVPEKVYRTACDTRGDLTPKCSALRLVDVWLLGNAHMYTDGEFTRSHWCSACAPLSDFGDCPLENAQGHDATPGWCRARLDPEGVLSSVPTVLTTWLGLHFGLVLTHYPAVSYRLKHWAVLSTFFFALGWMISPFCESEAASHRRILCSSRRQHGAFVAAFVAA